jgi:site-specific recombinase XerD
MVSSVSLYVRSENGYKKCIQNLATKAGISGAKCHRLRDTYITDQIQDGMDLLTIRKWIGHTNLEHLKLYSEALKAEDDRSRTAANRQDKRYASAAA